MIFAREGEKGCPRCIFSLYALHMNPSTHIPLDPACSYVESSSCSHGEIERGRPRSEKAVQLSGSDHTVAAEESSLENV